MLSIESNSYIINHLNLALSKKILNNSIIFTKKNIRFIKLLHKIGCISRYYILSKNNKPVIRFSVFFYKNKPFFKGIKLVSTSSKKFYISYKALKITNKFLKSSHLVLSTSKGLITHRDAINYKIGGIIICVIS